MERQEGEEVGVRGEVVVDGAEEAPPRSLPATVQVHVFKEVLDPCLPHLHPLRSLTEGRVDP